MIAAVLLNAIVPGAGHALLRRFVAAALWLAITTSAYIVALMALVYSAVSLPSFHQMWRFGELRVVAAFLLPAVIVHTACCVSVLPAAVDRRRAIACAAVAMLLLIAASPDVDLGVRAQIEHTRTSR